jgi:hypothetical protein
MFIKADVDRSLWLPQTVHLHIYPEGYINPQFLANPQFLTV